MAITLIEIMKLTEKLSPDEQLELAAKLIEQVRKNSTDISPPRQLEMKGYPATGPANQTVDDKQGEEDVEGPNIFRQRLMPPEDFFVAQMRFVDADKRDPADFDFSEIFDDEDRDSQS